METRVIPPDHASMRQTEMGETFNRVLFSALDAMESRQIPYALIGGIAASGMGRPRSTHDIDIFVRPEDADASLEALASFGFETEKVDRRWLYKGWKEEMMVDVIFKSQGDIYFDSEMQQHAKRISYHGRQIPAVAPEDLMVIKAAVHSEIGPHHWHDALALLSHASIDWQYLLKRARRAHKRLLSLLIYAQSNDIWVPNGVINELFETVFGGHVPTKSTVQNQASPLTQGAQRTSQSQQTAQQTTQNQTQQTQTQSQQSRPSFSSTDAIERTKGTPIQELYLVPHLQEALATDCRTAALDIRLNLGGKKISVKGEASSEEQRRAIEEVIRVSAQGFEVDNQVRLTDITPPQAEEIV